jgi:hypothetical protein
MSEQQPSPSKSERPLVAEVFDVAAAIALARVIQGHSGPLGVDFGHVSYLSAFALIALAGRIRPGMLVVHGLRQHHRALMKMLGLEGFFKAAGPTDAPPVSRHAAACS